jgi:hypothetical protein
MRVAQLSMGRAKLSMGEARLFMGKARLSIEARLFIGWRRNKLLGNLLYWVAN